mmetsp:Transcript_24955/g.50685  ORF Transcript_24955/g.50685 Transcript_24955/m.50685 type:complete len:106 (+) Transcript_24955:77-394(+)
MDRDFCEESFFFSRFKSSVLVDAFQFNNHPSQRTDPTNRFHQDAASLDVSVRFSSFALPFWSSPQVFLYVRVFKKISHFADGCFRFVFHFLSYLCVATFCFMRQE